MSTRMADMELFLSKLRPEDAKCILKLLEVEGTAVRFIKWTETDIELGFENRQSFWTIHIVPAIRQPRIEWSNT